MPLQPGMIIDRYRILEPGSSNLLSSVYLAEDITSLSPVIVRTYFEGRETSDSFQVEFSVIAKKLIALDHPHLEKVLDYGSFDDVVFLVCENSGSFPLSDGLTLPINSKEAAELLTQVAEGLQYLHSQELVHGDLSPQNILIDPQNHVRLVGYGLYSLLSREVSWAMPDSIQLLGIGSLSGKPPEQIYGREPEPQSDIFALGALFFNLLTNQEAFSADSPIGSSLLKTNLPVGWPSKLKVKVTSSAVRFIHRCLARKPEHRFQSMNEVLIVLRRLASGKFSWIRANKAVMADRPKQPPYLLFSLFVLMFFAAASSGGYYQLKYIPEVQATGTSLAVTNIARTPTIAPTSTQTPTPTPIQPTFTPTFTVTPTRTATATPTPNPTYNAVIKVTNVSGLTLIQEAQLKNRFANGMKPEGVKRGRVKDVLAFSPDGKYLVASGISYRGTLLDGTTLNEVASFNGRTAPGQPFSPDSKSLLIIERKRIALPLSKIAEDAEYLNRISVSGASQQVIGPYREQNDLAFTPDGKLIVMGEATSTRAWDVKTSQPIVTIDGGEFGCQVLRAKHNREFIAAFSTNGFMFNWDAPTQYICSLRRTNSILSPDQKSLAYINSNGLLQVDDLETREMLWREPVKAVAYDFSPDNSMLAVGSATGFLTIWDAKTGEGLANYDHSIGQILAMKFSPNGKYVAVMNEDYSIFLFGVYASE